MYDHFPMMIASLPMTWTMGEKPHPFFGNLKKEITGYGPDLVKMGRTKRTITREPQNTLPFIGEWKGQNSPGMLLQGRRGQALLWNPFSTILVPNPTDGQTEGNYNSVIGQSGSGKSVFVQELMLSVVGVSFKKTCQLLGGQHIEFDLRNPISVNPFSTIPTDDSPESLATRDESLALLKPIL